MNDLERKTYSEPNFDIADIIDEFVNKNMSEEEKEKIRQQTVKLYDDMTDEDWRHLGDNY